jgi:hypothetical protein
MSATDQYICGRAPSAAASAASEMVCSMAGLGIDFSLRRLRTKRGHHGFRGIGCPAPPANDGRLTINPGACGIERQTLRRVWLDVYGAVPRSKLVHVGTRQRCSQPKKLLSCFGGCSSFTQHKACASGFPVTTSSCVFAMARENLRKYRSASQPF